MTTVDHARDWKVTAGYRILLRVAWLLAVSSILLAVVAALDNLVVGWWAAAGLAALALFLGAILPEPLPVEMITGNNNLIDGRSPPVGQEWGQA